MPGSLIVFGDSLSDNGVDLYNDKDGFRRYSTGPVWPEYLSKMLNFELMDYAYSGGKSGLGNYNFPQQWSGILWQVQKYVEKYPKIPSNHLIAYQTGGANDLEQNDFNVTIILENNLAALQLLISHFAPRIIVFGFPDFSKIPAYSGDAAKALLLQNITNTLNYGLIEFMKINSRIRIDFFDAAKFFREKLSSFSHNEPFIYQNNTELQPGNIFNYSFYDSWHPATGVHFMIAEEMTKIIGPVGLGSKLVVNYLILTLSMFLFFMK